MVFYLASYIIKHTEDIYVSLELKHWEFKILNARNFLKTTLLGK